MRARYSFARRAETSVALESYALEALAAELAAQHKIHARACPCDLGDAAARARLFEELGGLEVEVLVNNAGFGLSGRFWENDAAREVAMVELNVTALTHLTRLWLPQLVARGRGHVLNIGSTAGFQPGPGMATYYATKAFVVSFTQALAYELRGTGVSATVSCPGPVATEFGAISGNEKSALFKQAGGVADPATIAREAWAATRAGKAIVVHGLSNKVGATLAQVLPTKLVTTIAARLNRVES